MKYIALLRGINISGKNKISMSELKLELEKNKYQNVSTYLNSGNVIFESNINNKEDITNIRNGDLSIPNYDVYLNDDFNFYHCLNYFIDDLMI